MEVRFTIVFPYKPSISPSLVFFSPSLVFSLSLPEAQDLEGRLLFPAPRSPHSVLQAAAGTRLHRPRNQGNPKPQSPGGAPWGEREGHKLQAVKVEWIPRLPSISLALPFPSGLLPREAPRGPLFSLQPWVTLHRPSRFAHNAFVLIRTALLSFFWALSC